MRRGIPESGRARDVRPVVASRGFLRGACRVASILVAAHTFAEATVAQGAPAVASGLARTRPAVLPLTELRPHTPPSAGMPGIAAQPNARQRAPWWAAVASAVIPGSGQVLLGQQRGVAYAVAEGFLLVQALGAQRDVRTGIRDYQELAANAARRQFGGSLPRGSWSYYEAVDSVDASGMYDVVPGGAIDPETDLSTFNGQSWLLARQTFWNDPDVAPPTTSGEYQRALAFYARRAWTDEFRWSWRDAQLQKGEYKRAIGATNRSNQRKTNLLTVVGANHLASLIDAYITVRIRRYGGAGVVGMRLDGVDSRVAIVGDPAAGARSLRTSIRLVPTGSRSR